MLKLIMTEFLTDQETEDLLNKETRNLRWHGGGEERAHTAMRLLWRGFDFIGQADCWVQEKTLELSILAAKESGRSFGQCFEVIVSHLIEGMTQPGQAHYKLMSIHCAGTLESLQLHPETIRGLGVLKTIFRETIIRQIDAELRARGGKVA